MKSFLTILALMAWLQYGAEATSMFSVGLQELTQEAEKVVQARVTSIVTQWTPDSMQIMTYVRMNIVDDMFGPDEDNEIILKQAGGRMGTLTMSVEGTTTYKINDNNIVFLRKDLLNNATYQTVGMYQGKYRIFTDLAGVQRVAQDVNGKVILYKGAKAAAEAIETGNNMTLDEFKNKVIEYRSSK